MTTTTGATSAEIRARVGHPVIDADGHVLELMPLALGHLETALGSELFAHYQQRGPIMARNQARRSLDERRRSRAPQGAWWGTHTVNVRDRATAMLPGLLYERMDEIGIDLTVLYPTNSLLTCAEDDPSLRQGLCRGFNRYYAEVYGSYRDRLRIAGIIPMHTPDEAIAELEHCHELGLSVVVFPEGVRRPLEEVPGDSSSLWLYPGQTQWFDCFALDSVYDYDPVWARAQELGFAITFHGGLDVRPGLHTSITSYSYNHLAQFQQSMLPLAKALIMGGVTRRFPDTAFVFLECGVTWGVQLLVDTVEHWEKRRLEALEMYDPDRLDVDALAVYFERYGQAFADRLGGDLGRFAREMPIHGGTPEEPDEWIHVAASSEADLLSRFDNLYYGCEADDRGVAVAYSKVVPDGARVNPVFSSDIGHWDVTDIASVVSASWNLVEDGLLTEADFRAFMFETPARMYTAANPSFFDGTPVAAHL